MKRIESLPSANAGETTLFMEGWNAVEARQCNTARSLATLPPSACRKMRIVANSASVAKGIQLAEQFPDEVDSLIMVAPHYLDGSDNLARLGMAALGKSINKAVGAEMRSQGARMVRRMERAISAVGRNPLDSFACFQEITKTDYTPSLERIRALNINVGAIVFQSDELFPRNSEDCMVLTQQLDVCTVFADPEARHGYFLNHPEEVLPVIDTMLQNFEA